MSKELMLEVPNPITVDPGMFEHSCPLADIADSGAAVAGIAAGERRALRCAGVSSQIDIPTCIGAWHAVLHLLRHGDDPVVTCLRGADDTTSLPILTRASGTTMLADLIRDVRRQWREAPDQWLRVADHAESGLLDQLRCHAIVLDAANRGPQQLPEFALIHDADGWRIDCAAEGFGEAYPRTIAALWHAAVAAAVEAPGTLVVDALARDADENSGPSVSVAGTLVSRFSDVAASRPEGVAVVDTAGSITFAELDTLSSCWSAALLAMGVGRGECVGVSFGRNRRMIAAQLAVLKAGAAFVPLDTAQPGVRLSSMADDADMRIVLAERDVAAALEVAIPSATVLVVEDIAEPASRGAVSAVDTSADDLAYVIFTSGSTGRPKGVKVSHRNLLNFVVQIGEWFAAGEAMSQFAPFTFDAAVAEIHASILNGGTVVLLSPELIDDPERLQQYLTAQRVAFMAVPPQYAKHLSPDKLPTLKTLLTAGSAPDHELIRRWHERVRYINAYGPTETTVLSTAWIADRAPEVGEPIKIGRPINNTTVKIVNRFGRALPTGCVGELLIGGAGVAQGYLKRTELDDGKFVDADGERWYCSGDLACIAADGELIFAGRVDDQIKLRGHRLEPGEVEIALASLPGMQHAAVVAVDIDAGKQLIAFCVGERQADADVRTGLAGKLPAWALPNRLVWLEAMPITVNGKVDYRLLRQRAQHNCAAATAAGADALDAVESEVAQVWRNVLQQPVLSRDDHFVHLGGDSLTALVVMSALKRIGYQATSSQLLALPRLADFADLLRHSGTRLQRQYERVEGSAPLGPIQGWFFDLSLRNPSTFCQTLVVEADEALDAARLENALRALIDHHDGLRARFLSHPQYGWRQDIAADDPVLPAIVVETIDQVDDAWLSTATNRMREALAADIDIAQAPLFRVGLLRSGGRSRIVWVLHHLIVDTISHALLLEDLQQLYERSAEAPCEVLPGKSTSYLDWSAAIHREVTTHAASHLHAWRPILARVASADRLHLGDAATAGKISIVDCALGRADTAALIERATACYRQSTEDLVLAATYLAFQRSFGLQSLAIDIEWHGRDEATGGDDGIDRTVGWFTSVHPLSMDLPAELLSSDGALGDWLVALKDSRAAVPQRGRHFYAMRYLSDDADTRAAFAQYRSPQVLFNFSGVVQRSQAGWKTVPTVAIELGDGNASPYAVSVESEIRDGELTVSLYLDTDAWPAGVADRLRRDMGDALRRVIAHCVDPAHGRWTVSDFPRIALDRAALDRLPRGVKDVYPLTDMQQTMYRHKDTYQVVMCYRMPMAFDAAAWTPAVADWVARHDCLRAFIRELPGGALCQIVLDALQSPITVHRVAVGEAPAQVLALVDARRACAVVIDQAPLFDLQIVDDGGDAFDLVLSIHHIIHDGWSIDLLLNDLLQAYRHRSGLVARGPSAPLAGMADIVDQQQRLRDDPKWRAYWNDLPWAAASAQLPASLKARAGDDALARRDVRLYQAPMDPTLADEVRAGARRLGVTVNSLWLAGYVALLRYLGGQTQVRCGVIQNGRMEEIPGVETITGCCVNNLPLVIDVGAEDTAERIVANVAAQLDRMRESAAFPLSLIHESVKTRIEGELFDVLFNIESHRYGADDGQARPLLTGGYESTNYGFIFGLIERDPDASQGLDGGAQTGYSFRIGYDADRYALSSVQDWVRIYGECLRALVADPQRPWRSIDPLPDDLRTQALNAWNDTTRRYPSERCVEALFREQAEAHPDRPALLYRDRVVGYAQLDALSDHLAAVLQQRGIGPENIVALVVDRSPDMVVAMLAIYKAGAAFVPIDPRYPVDRVRHMVADTATTLALVQNRTLDYVIPDDLAVERLYLNGYLDEYADVRALDTASPAALAPVARDSRQLAYVMYTSGSTGNPKGVMIEQRSIVRLIANSEDIRFAPEDRILLTSAPGFDVTTFEVWSALLNGLALGIIDEETLLDPPALRREIVGKRITMLWLIAPLFNQLVQEMPDLFAGVKQLMIGGDALSPAHVQMVRDANPGLQVINGYGPTENTSFSTYHFVGDADQDVIPIGRPITNSTAYVVNADGQLLPPGVNGELWVGGPGVARGYLNQPDLTASKFVADRFGHGSGHDVRDTLYRTGDLVRWRRDGLIDFLGRIDHQVKIRGFRIELGEIENTIAEHPAIKQTVVLVKQDGMHKQLVAYCVPKTFDPADGGRHAALATDVSDSMRHALPDYMVPSAFVFLPEFARNTNGKIDRGVLAAIDIAAFMLGSRVEPETDAERTLWSIWRDVLGTGAFGVTDSFFAVGGDSIMAIQVTSRAAKAGLALSQRTIIEKRTIRDIAATLAPAAADPAPMQSATVAADAASTAAQPLRFTLNADGDGGGLLIESESGKLSPERARALKAQLAKALAMLESMPEDASEASASSTPSPAAPSPTTAAFDGIGASTLDHFRSAYPDLQDVRACTAMQDGMLLFSDSESADGQYVTQIRLILAGLDAARMRRSWEILIARHEALRTVFAASADAGMLQFVLGDVVLPWEEIDLSAADDAESALAHALEDARNRPFDPSRAPLMRVLAARIDGGRHCMAWSYHHALIDGWSMALLLKELFDLYAGDLDAGAAHAVVSSRDYLAWLRGRDKPQAAAYWQQYLSGLDIAASATLPLSTSSRVDEREGAQSLQQTSHKRSLDDAASARIAAFARRQNVSLGTVMLAAWGMLLGKYNNEPEVLFGYTTSGRSVPVDGIESMTGLFINSLPIRLAIEGDTAVGDWLRTIQARQLDHEDHCHVPLTEIQRHSGRSPGQKLYESMVVVENFPIDPSLMSMRTETGTRLLAVEAEGQNDVALVLTVFPGTRIAIDMACRASLFDAAHATRLLDQFEQLLLSLSADDVHRLGDVSMLDAAQRRRALETWNDTAADYPRTLRFNEVFEEIAARHADATALVLDGDRWSYRRLAERARAIGVWLKRNGVRPNDKVALSLEREPELIASMLGAMYAEAAYVPIALNCPQERRAYMIGNAGIRHIVSRREHAANIEASGIAPLYLEDCPQRDDVPYAGRTTPDANAESAVYVIYTSGTTGTPKGVEVTHRNLVNYSSWFVSADYAQPGDRFTQFAPYTFDASVGEIYASLHVGGELHFLTDALIENPRDLERYFRDHSVSFTILPPPYLHQMEPTAVPQDLVVMTIGSAPTIELVQRWAPHCRYVNAYGPTETTYMSSAWNCEGRRFDDAVLSVGRPIANTTMYIVDRLGQLCAPGLTGEVYIGGDGVSCGYFNQPELTAKSFIRDPWRPQERVYRTGDLGRWLDDGRIEFLGRRDRQVKVRGFRIELNEIEDRIRQHPDVSEATVQVRGDDDQKRLLAWVVRNDRKAGAADGVPQFVAELRAFIAESLPHYMIPQAIVTLEQMPLSTNGKLDARALPEAGQQDWFRSEYVAPEGEIEQRLVEIWSALLKIPLDQLSVTADFFESGGDSIMAIQAASRAAKHDIPLSPRRIIEGKHIRGIAARIAEALAASAKPGADQVVVAASAAAVGPAQASPLSLSREEVEALTTQFAPVEAVYPCTGMQQGLLMLVDGQHQDGLYVTQLRIDVGAVEPARMRRSWERLIARHPILRTSFARAGDGRFAQVVHPEVALPWEEADLRGASGRRRDDELDALIAQARCAGFDLQRPPLMRVLLARLEDARYAMVWTHHHALMDGWSMASLAKELFGIYASLDASRDAGPDAGPDAVGAHDDVRRPGFDRYVQWLDARDWAAADAYWTRYLAGLDLSASADLPMAFAPDDKTTAHRQGQDSVKIALDEDTGLALNKLCRTEKVGIGTAMLAAWGLLLSKYNTEQDVLFGYTSSGRPAEIDDVESLVGLFINSLPIRVGIAAEVAIGDWLRDIQRHQLDNEDQGFMPLSDIHRASGRRAGQALFESLVVVENFPIDHAKLSAGPGRGVEILGVQGLVQTDFPLNLVVIPGDRPTLELVYQNARFDRGTIQTMVARLEQILRGFAAGGGQRIADIAILTDAERTRAIHDWNDTRTDAPRDKRLPELYDVQMQVRPDAIAVVSGDDAWSYRRLGVRAKAIAAALLRQGAVPGARIGLALEKGPELVASMLGIHYAGGAYVPIAVDCPPERRAFILADAGIAIVISERRFAAEIAVVGVDTLLLDDIESSVLDDTAFGGDAAARIAAHGALSEAYVIYTSGTTGMPKGVAISHRNLINFCLWCGRPGMIAPGMRTAQFAPYTFDASAGEIFSALVLGAELHLLSNALIQDPRALADYYREHDIQFSAFSPPYLQQLSPEQLPAGMTIVTAGSAPSVDLVKRWGAHFHYVNGYGPTETTILSTAWACEAGRYDGGRLPIGRPIDNTSVYVVDGVGQLCAPGLTGEIMIAGDGVALGYLNREDLNAVHFIDDPWRPGQRLYRTGDHGRWLDDGNIEFVGRRDRQIKLRGYRIELNEIEARLLQHPEVEAGAVSARGDHDDKRLLAWVVRRAGDDSGHDDGAFVQSLRDFMAQTLPAYMLPQAILTIDRMPLTANGKIDEKALPQPDADDWFAGEYVAPRNDTESRIAEIWAQVLQIEPAHVGATADFFESGGNSLLAMRVVARVREVMGMEVGVADLLANPVLGSFADAMQTSHGHVKPPVARIDRSGPLPLSFAQQRLWFLAQMEGASNAYNVPGALRMTGVLDKAALQRALDRIVARHETLRTQFDAVDGAPQPRILPADVGFGLRHIDLRDLSGAEDCLVGLMNKEAGYHFDLRTTPLIRGLLVQLGEREHALLVTMHHIVMDAWSIARMIQELGQLYSAFVAGSDDPLPALAVQYVDYAAWQRDWLRGDVWDAQSRYWQDVLSGAPAVLELPTDRLRPAQQDYAGDVLPFAFEPGLSAALRTLAQRNGTTLYMTMLAAWSVVLSRLSGQSDIVIGSPVTNRAQADIEPLIGFFVNTLAFRIDLSGTPTVAELLARVRDRVIAGQQHQDLPFERVVDLVQPPRSMAHTPIFQVMFNWQDDSRDALGMGDVKLAPIDASHALAKFDLNIDMYEDGGRIRGAIEYTTALFDRDTVERHFGYLQRVLEAMVADPHRSIHRIELLGDAELKALDGFNDTCRPELIQRTWPELFDAQVAATPDRVAVECDRQRLTYAELDARSARIAHALVSRGAGPGTLVALLARRDTDLLATIVGVLRAGAAYVPLDPTHPQQRWLEILDEADPALLWIGEGALDQRDWIAGRWQRERIVLDADFDAASQADAVLAWPSLDDLAYVIFTSGSTGKPKGVMIEHRGMINNMLSKFEPLSLGDGDVIAQTASQCFDISVWQFLTALLLGAKVSIVSSETTRDPEALLRRLDATGVTVWEPVPSVMQAVLPLQAPLPKMRWVLPTGEALPRELVTRWFEQFPSIPLMNAYGPAECSDDVSFQPMYAPVDRVSIGSPVANAHLHVVDDYLMLLPMGAVGELAISGPVVGRGYLNRPAETEAVFRPNPFARHDADRRLYLTSDLVRRARDGSLEFVGRKDFQVKIRGFRIELGEIESCFETHPSVLESVVLARDMAGEKRLVAYVTQSEPASAEAMLAHLRTTLPDYMIPSAIVVLERMPLTPNGKIDRKAMPEPSQSAMRIAEYEAPQTELERTVATVWQELLDVPEVGRHDSFFDIGGNSILLMRMLSRLREAAISLSIVDVYQLRTVQAIAEAAERQTADIDAWLADAAWPHQRLSVRHGDEDRSVLLLEDRPPQKIAVLKQLIARSAAADRPWCIQTTDNVERLAAAVCSSGLKALGHASRIDAAGVRDDIARRLQAKRNRVAAAMSDESFPFSGIQKSLSTWQHRNALQEIVVQGWWSQAELADAFAWMTRDQDLLRAVPHPAAARWRLVDGAAFVVDDVPWFDLRGVDAGQTDATMRDVGERLLAALGDSPLPYAAAWLSLSDTEHRLLLAADHLIWDGVSSDVMARRLSAALTGARIASARRYRDYIADTEACGSDVAAQAVFDAVDPAALADATAATRRALETNADKPLQVIAVGMPRDADRAPAEHAFDLFKRAVIALTGLDTFGMVLNHHGRQLGSRTYFDQVGLFLDKIPHAVARDTKLDDVLSSAERFQKQGVHCVSADGSAATRHLRLLPAPADEVMFNFQPIDAEDPMSGAPDAAQIRARFDGFRGIIFEAYCSANTLGILLIFRDDQRRADAVRTLFDGEKRFDNAAGIQPHRDGRVDMNANTTTAAIEIHDVRKRYGDLEVVKGVSFRVEKGCCIGILGPNGAGKTSLLGMIEGIVPITSGRISVLGKDVATQIRQIQPRIGVQLQQNNYFQFLTVAELLDFYMELRTNNSGKRTLTSPEKLLTRLDLTDKLKFKVDELSGGQKQRLSIAIALLGDPEVIFLDEPTSALDPHSRRYTWEFIEELKEDRDRTIVLTTHYMEEAERLCDEILIMNQGEIVDSGNPATLVATLNAQQQVRFKFEKGVPGDALAGDLGAYGQATWDEFTDTLIVTTDDVATAVREGMSASTARGVPVLGLDIGRLSLEDVFLNKTGKGLKP